MANTWGATTLNIMEYQRDSADLMLNEVDLIPDLDDDGDEPQTALIGWGTRRRRIQMKLLMTDTEYHAFGVDHQNYTTRALALTSIEDSLSWTLALISKIQMTKQKAVMVPGTSYYYNFVDIEFLEVDSGV